MVDLATLTGAVLVALGQEHAGIFTNDDELGERLIAAGKETGEKLWRLPLGPAYDKLIDSKFADMKNTGGRHAGSITAAQFLQRFVNGAPWAHLDIAGTGMSSPPDRHQPELGLGLRRAAARPARRRSLRGLAARGGFRWRSGSITCSARALNRRCRAFIEKSLANGWRVVVQARSEERLDALDQWLVDLFRRQFSRPWARRRRRRRLQPVYLSTGVETPNGARRGCSSKARKLRPGSRRPLRRLAPMQRTIIAFDGNDEDELARAAAVERPQGAGFRHDLLAPERGRALGKAGVRP